MTTPTRADVLQQLRLLQAQMDTAEVAYYAKPSRTTLASWQAARDAYHQANAELTRLLLEEQE